MAETLSSSIEDYLEAILALSEDADTNSARVTDLAARLGVTKASVSEAAGYLKNNGYVIQEKYGRITLTTEGRARAIAVRRRHQVLRTFLVGVLGVNADTAEKEACLMEHAVGSETMELLVAFLEKTLVKPGQ